MQMDSLQAMESTLGATVVEIFEDQVELHPNEPAASYLNTTITYAELNTKANRLAHYLRDLGVTRESIVAICIERSIDYLIGIIAINKAGGAFLPIDEKQPVERLQLILQDSDANIVVTRAHVAEKFDAFTGKVIFVDRDDGSVQNQSNTNPGHINKGNDLAYVIYTSGTTGAPKGVMIEHHNVDNYILWFTNFIESIPGLRIDFSTNPIFDMAITNSLAALCMGLHVVICPDRIKKNLRDYLNFIQQTRINVIKFTPSYFKVLLQEMEANPITLPDLETIVFGGETLLTEDCARWFKFFPHHIIYNEYGPTEITVAFCQFKVTPDVIETLGIDVPIGLPGDNMCFHLDENSELYIGGKGLARGYINNAKLTNERFVVFDQRYYKTGDVCRVLPTGDLVFLGRNDDQVKIRGFRIEPAEIEVILASHPELLKVAVIPQEASNGNKELVAYFIPKNFHAPPTTESLREFISLKVADYMVPSAFIAVEEFVLNANNKLDKKALPNHNDGLSKTQKNLPQTDLEKLIASVWAEALNLNEVGRDEHFFTLGGHSLSAARIVSKLIKTTDKKIFLQDIYTSGTIAELAEVVKLSEPYTKENHTSTHIKNAIQLSDFQLMFWMSNLYEPKTKTLNVVSRKRVFGKLNKDALQYACNQLIAAHEILSYRVAKSKPVVVPQKKLQFKLFSRNIKRFKPQHREEILIDSLDDLIKHYPWRPDQPAFIARLYYVDENISEVQICMPHILSDDFSADIAFKDLSEFYLEYFTTQRGKQKKLPQYPEYVHYEHNHINRNFDRDIAYWEKRLANTIMYPFPKEYVIPNMDSRKTRFSSYFELSEELLNKLRKHCAKEKVSLTNALCAALALTLAQFYDAEKYQNQSIFFNLIKTTREDEAFDHMIGCFLKLDAFKLDMQKDSNIFCIARDIQKMMIDNAPYQHCSGLLKVACINPTFWKKYKIFNLAIKAFSKLYSSFFSNIKLNAKIIQMYGRLFFFGRDQYFLVNINLWGNFIGEQSKQAFGYKQKALPLYQYDLSVINNVLDICFLRDESNVAYLVISANLKPEFRDRLGEMMLQYLNT